MLLLGKDSFVWKMTFFFGLEYVYEVRLSIYDPWSRKSATTEEGAPPDWVELRGGRTVVWTRSYLLSSQNRGQVITSTDFSLSHPPQIRNSRSQVKTRVRFVHFTFPVQVQSICLVPLSPSCLCCDYSS